MSTKKQFLSIAGRWREHVRISGLDKALPSRELSLAMMMFYAGFSASLDAGVEIAEFPDDEALGLLSALHHEVKQVQAVVDRVGAGGLTS